MEEEEEEEGEEEDMHLVFPARERRHAGARGPARFPSSQRSLSRDGLEPKA